MVLKSFCMQDKGKQRGGFSQPVLSWRNWEERHASKREVESSSPTVGNFFYFYFSLSSIFLKINFLPES